MVVYSLCVLPWGTLAWLCFDFEVLTLKGLRCGAQVGTTGFQPDLFLGILIGQRWKEVVNCYNPVKNRSLIFWQCCLDSTRAYLSSCLRQPLTFFLFFFWWWCQCCVFYLIVTLKEKVYPPLEVSDYTGEKEPCTRASDVTRPMINTIQSLKTSVTGQKASNFGPLFNFGNFTSILQCFTLCCCCFFPLEDYSRVKMNIYSHFCCKKKHFNWWNNVNRFILILWALWNKKRACLQCHAPPLVPAHIHRVALFCHCLRSQ